MLDKNIDYTLIGKNYLSFMHAFKLLDKGQSVLILDDERVKYGNLFSNYFGPLEKSFIETWGEDITLEDLSELDNFTKKTPVTLIFDNRRIALGDSPYRNLVELHRKLPELFLADSSKGSLSDLENISSSDEFNEMVLSLSLRVGQNAYRFKNVQNFDLDSFLTHCPSYIKSLFSNFLESYRKITDGLKLDDDEVYNFLYLTRSLYQHKMRVEVSDFEAFHLFLCLLSPLYNLEHQNLVNYLSSEFHARGGKLKQTQIREWRFHKGKPWSMELASYEGIIHPEKMALMGSKTSSMPINVGPHKKFYSSVNLKFELKEEYISNTSHYAIIGQDKVGTEIPFFQFIVEDDSLKVSVCKLSSKGEKLSFYKEDLIKLVLKEVERALPTLSSKLGECEFEIGGELWVFDGTNQKRSRAQLPNMRKVFLYDRSNPLFKTKLKNFEYYGPFKEGPLGLMSCMMELNDSVRFN